MPRDGRTYITVHDGMPDHPKVEPLSDRAFRLMVETWCWCSRYETDGRVPAAVWARRGTAPTRRELTAAGLVEEVDGGVQMHDYLEHQRSAEKIRELREARAEAGRKGGQARSKGQASATASAQATAKQTGCKVQPETESETEVLTPHPSGGAPSAAPKATRGTRLPNPYPATDDMQAWARAEAPNAGERDHVDFCEYWWAKAGRDAVKVDWRLTWQRWMRKASEERTARPARGQGPAPMDRARDVADIAARLQAQHDAATTQQTALEA